MRPGLLLALLLAALPAVAAPQPSAPAPLDGTLELTDVRLGDGETMPRLHLHYLTFGTAQRDGAGRIVNAVLLLHGTSGDARSFLLPGFADSMFGPGQPLDPARYFLVIPDGIGAGLSSKPSDGLGGRFPHYTYADQVELQRRLLHEALGIDHLRLVLGTSMGGMQAWLWAERFPDMMNAVVPMGAMPVAVSGRNMLWRAAVMQAIRDDPDWHDGAYDRGHPPTQWAHSAAIAFALMTGNAERLQERAQTRDAAIVMAGDLLHRFEQMKPDDVLYALDSSAGYNPWPDLERIRARLLAINFADDLVNPVELGVMPPAMRRIAHGQFVLVPAPGGWGHQGLAHPELWGHYLAEFLAARP